MRLIDRILSRDEFHDEPPVLMDIGASGGLNRQWRRLAKYAICITFDADKRDVGFLERRKKRFRKLYIYDCVAVERAPRGLSTFFLTASPYCSSRLEPDSHSLHQWAFADLFRVETTVELKALGLPKVLKELGINRIDWFKTDSQGTDLRLFKSIESEIRKKVLVVEFEPGIIDAYQEEDKLHDVLRFMESAGFWMCDAEIGGSQRIQFDLFSDNFNARERRYFNYLTKTSPGWMKVTYFNSLASQHGVSIRDYLLAYVLALLNGQYAFAFEIASRAQKMSDDPFFDELAVRAKRRIKARMNILMLFWIFVNKAYRKIKSFQER